MAQMVAGAIGMGLFVFGIVAIVKACTRQTAGWVVTAVITTLLAIGAVGGAGVMAFIKMAEAADKVERRLTSKDGRFSLAVPSSWKSSPGLNENAVIGAAHRLREQYVIVIPSSKEESGPSMAAFAKELTENFGHTVDGVKLGEFTNLTINGMPALRRKIEGKVEGLGAVYLHTTVETPDSYCQVLCWTLAGREKTAFPVFEKVAASFTARGARSAQDLARLPAGERARNIAAEVAGIDEGAVKPASYLKADLALKDMDLTRLVMTLEERLEISIDNEVAREWVTVEDMMRHAESRVKSAPGGKR